MSNLFSDLEEELESKFTLTYIVRIVYQGIVEFLLWLCPVACIFIGGIIAGGDEEVLNGFLGFVIAASITKFILRLILKEKPTTRFFAPNIAGIIVGFIVCAIAVNNGEVFWGMLLGFLAGLIIDAIIGGFTATIINIDKNLERIVKHDNLSENEETPSVIPASTIYESPALEKVSPIVGKASSKEGDFWICKKCKEKNRAASLSCKGCGEYK